MRPPKPSLLPLPRSVAWSGDYWRTDDPFDGLTEAVDDALPVQDYCLIIERKGAHLAGGSPDAIAMGRSTFAQVIENCLGYVPTVRIEDGPLYPWRGLGLDVVSHFVPVSELRLIIDVLAMHRMNILHLRLTGDSAWRYEVRGYPLLTDAGARHRASAEATSAKTTSAGRAADQSAGFYSARDIEGLVAHATQRAVRIIPEVQLPARAGAAIAAYPRLASGSGSDGGNETTRSLAPTDAALRFTAEIVEATVTMFGAPFIHLGSHGTMPGVAPLSRTRHDGLSAPATASPRFLAVACAAAEAAGARPVVWDDAPSNSLPEGVIVMCRGPEADEPSAQSARQTILAGADILQLDNAQADAGEPAAATGVSTLRDVYGQRLVPKVLEPGLSPAIIGLEAILSTEHAASRGRREYQTLPRLCAVAERAWGSPERGFKDFRKRLELHVPRLDRLGATHRPLGDRE